MDTLKAIIVDDEEAARDVLENLLLRFCPEVKILSKCESVPEAVEKIKIENPDVVFLDIEMPNYSGYELVNFFENIDFEIIFVTAYDQYAIRAFEVAAIDYLLKPIDIERLKVAVGRVLSRLNRSAQNDRISVLKDTLKTQEVSNIIISEKGLQVVIPTEKIIAIEAQESYCVIHSIDNKKQVVSKNLKHFETILEGSPDFFRVHKSWIVNKNHVQNYSRTSLIIQMANGFETRLSRYRKTEFETFLAS